MQRRSKLVRFNVWKCIETHFSRKCVVFETVGVVNSRFRWQSPLQLHSVIDFRYCVWQWHYFCMYEHFFAPESLNLLLLSRRYRPIGKLEVHNSSRRMKRFACKIAALVVGNSSKFKMQDFAVFWIEMIVRARANTHTRARARPNTMNLNSIPSKAQVFFESAQPPVQWAPVELSSSLKRPGRETDPSPPLSAEVQNACSCTAEFAVFPSCCCVIVTEF
jgi:hypothetical protein